MTSNEELRERTLVTAIEHWRETGLAAYKQAQSARTAAAHKIVKPRAGPRDWTNQFRADCEGLLSALLSLETELQRVLR